MYDTFSNDYDRFVNWNNRLAGEMPFLEQLIRPLSPDGSPRVLDAACGTGMHAIALAQKGFYTSGADLSSSMVERARQNALNAGADVHFKTAGFGSLARTFGEGGFDAVICLGNSLPHLLNSNELINALTDFSNCLRMGGLLIIQNRNFDMVLANHDRWMEPQYHREGENEWLFLRFYDFGPEGLVQFNVVSLTRENQGSWNQRVSGTLLYPLRELEMVQSLRQAGFYKLDLYGNLAGDRFNITSSGNLVISAWKG